MAAQIRWMSPAIKAPPRKCINPLAHGAWENFNGIPVRTRPMKVTIMVKWRMISKVLNRRNICPASSGFTCGGKKDPLSSQFPLFPVVLSPPEDGVKPEDSKYRDEKRCHNDEDSIKHWLLLWIIMRGMGKPKHEVSIGSWMAFSTGLYQTCIGDERFRIILLQDAVKSMTIRTTRHQSWVA